MEEYKVKKLLEVRSGVSQQTGREWKTRDIVIEDNANVMYHDSLVATLNGEAVDRFTAKEGDVVGLELTYFAREHEGKWFNSVRVRNFALR